MSTNGSDTSSHIRQFGLYRTIDSKTEEFLKLSKKRQLKQGCACAAISTVITVAVVIIVLLIYEYMIAVEATIVQTKDIKNKTKYIKESPIADRLDGNYFGVDQDYYEKIPFLINDLQESYNDLSEAQIRSSRKEHRSVNRRLKTRFSAIPNKFIRRTSPRPFVYERRSPYPMPFTKTTTDPKLWFEQYRNSQRLKNLRDVVKYLERTLNAKFSDFYLPSAEDSKFSRPYIPVDNDKVNSEVAPQKIVKSNISPNHYTDPLLVFKPDSPGEINLLADGFRFAPSLKLRQEENANIDSTRTNERQKCRISGCPQHNRNRVQTYFIPNSERIKSTSLPIINNKANVMAPKLEVNPQENKKGYKLEFDKIYITTSRPVLFQFRQKPTLSTRRVSNKNKSSRLLDVNKRVKFSSSFTFDNNSSTLRDKIYEILMRGNETFKSQRNPTLFDNYMPNLKQEETMTPATDMKHSEESSLPRIEDYHVGSSGIIPIESSSTQTYPLFTSVPPPKDIYIPNQEQASTNPPDIIKFSPEDAKVPDQYLNLNIGYTNIDRVTESDIIWQNFESSKINNDEKEANTLIIKLKNRFETTTEANLDEAEQNKFVSTTEEEVESTTSTYVPQINGHYRNVKNKTLILLQESSEKYRKKRLEELLSIRNSTYVPVYVDIVRHRNNTISSDLS